MPTRTQRHRAQIEDLRIAFPSHDGAAMPAVRGVSLSLMRGERLGIVGESGSEKAAREPA